MVQGYTRCCLARTVKLHSLSKPDSEVKIENSKPEKNVKVEEFAS